MKRAVGYVRVSTRKDEQATSPENQRTMIEAECRRKGWELVACFEDKMTGGTIDRPDFSELRRYIERNPVNVMLINDLTRFGRETLEYLEFTRRFLAPRKIELWDVHGINGSERQVELVRLIQMWMGEDWRLSNKAKVKAAVEVCASKGYWNGVIPYGYYSSKRGRAGVGGEPDKPCVLQPDPDTAPVVRQMFEWAAAGARARTICSRLNSQGIASPTGVRWCNSSIERILRNNVYRGMVNYCGQHLPGAHEPLVDEKTWQQVSETIIPRQYSRKAGFYLLSRVYCPLFVRPDGQPLGIYGMTVRGHRKYALAQIGSSREVDARMTHTGARFPRTIDADLMEESVLECFNTRGDGELPMWWVEISRQAEDRLRREQEVLKRLQVQLAALGKSRTAQKRRLDRALDFGQDSDIRERYAELARVDSEAERVRKELANAEREIKALGEPLDMPEPMVQQLNVIQFLREQQNRAALREALAIVIKRVLVTLDNSGEIMLQLELRQECLETQRRVSEVQYSIFETYSV